MVIRLDGGAMVKEFCYTVERGCLQVKREGDDVTLWVSRGLGRDVNLARLAIKFKV